MSTDHLPGPATPGEWTVSVRVQAATFTAAFFAGECAPEHEGTGGNQPARGEFKPEAERSDFTY